MINHVEDKVDLIKSFKERERKLHEKIAELELTVFVFKIIMVLCIVAMTGYMLLVS